MIIWIRRLGFDSNKVQQLYEGTIRSWNLGLVKIVELNSLFLALVVHFDWCI